MHEASLVESLLEQVRSLVTENGGGEVDVVEVEIGPLSGVEPDLVDLAFQRLAPEFGFPAARLTIRWVPLRVRCGSCGGEESLADFRFRCPRCGASDLRVLQGDAFVLQQIQLHDPEVKEGPP